MNIELVGMPGVGKSYICRDIEERIDRSPDPLALTTPVFDRLYLRILPDSIRKVWRAGMFLIHNPRTVANLYREVFKGKGSLCIARCTKFVNLLSECQRSQAAHKSKPLMTDQGVLQGIWSLEMLAEESLQQRLMQISSPWLPDVVILVDADPSQNKQQLKHRKNGKSRFDRMQGEELRTAMELGKLKRDDILALWGEMVPKGHRLDFMNQPGSDARLVFDWLTDRLR